MSKLGERVARAYGWEREVPPGDVTLWLVGDPSYYMTTPEPENSWGDFGALLEWFSTWLAARPQHHGRCVSLCHHFMPIRNEGWDWQAVRRAVTEDILEVVEHD